jgi:hypothetical protein
MIRYLSIFLCVAGCSGGGGPAAVAAVPQDQAFVSLFDQISGQAVTNATVVQGLGQVDYTGIARLNLPLNGAGQVAYFGDLSVQFDFTAPSLINGQIRDLRADTGTLAGTLTLGNGSFDPTANPFLDYQFSADVAGNLTQAATTYNVTAQMQGDFRGADGAGINGVFLRGDLRNGTENVIFDGAFAAAKTQ